MYTKTSLMALCAAATVKEVVGAHGHQHAHDKRVIAWAATETVVVTEVFTVTATGTATGSQETPSGFAPGIKERPGHLTPIQSSVEAPVEQPTSSAVVVESSTSSTAVAPATTSSSSSSVAAAAPTTTSSIQSIASTTSSAIAASATKVFKASAPKSSGKTKRGLAYNDASLVQQFLNLGGQASWAYNWGPFTSALPSGVTFYPMLWSPASDHSNGWDGYVKQAVANGADALLGFNEPDNAGQADLAPAAAAQAHIQFMNPYAGQARIGSPAITSSETPGQGVDWLNQFFSACAGQCQVDFCVAHWYGPGGDEGAGLFLSHLNDVQKACNGKPVWVTEFQANNDVDTFMSNVTSALDSSSSFDFVEKYSYFMTAVGSLDLFQTATELTSYGKIYAGLN